MPEVYRLKLNLRGVSPMIWRRLLVTSDTTLYQLHQAIQIVMNWDNYYLYQFKLFARQFSCRAVSCEDDRKVYLEDFQLQPGEHFLYEYNFYCFWQVDVRFEKALLFEQGKQYPCCTGGKGDPPPEDIGGPIPYMQWLDDRYSFDTMNAVYSLCEAGLPVLTALLGNDEAAFRQAHAEFKTKLNTDEVDVAVDKYRHSAWNRDDDELFKRRIINQQLKTLLTPVQT